MRRLLRLLKVQEGIVMPLVVVIIASVMVLGITAVFIVQSQMAMGQRYSESEEALYISEAGVNRALYLLNEHQEFYKNPGMIDYNDDDGNLLSDGSFLLDLEKADLENPEFTIKSTGSLYNEPEIRRTIEVKVRKRSFTNYVYFSDNDGSNIWWAGTEKCYGPLHTNTSLNIRESPEFFNTVTFSVGDDVNKGVNYNPKFHYFEGYEPQKVAPLLMPPNNESLEIVALSLFPDHHYTGRTSILLKGDKYDVHYWDSSSGSYILQIDKSLPTNGVIYVAGDEGTGSSSPNKFGNNMGNVFVSGQLSGRLTIAAENNIYITGRDPTEFNYDNAAITDCGGVCYEYDEHDDSIFFDVDYSSGTVSVKEGANDMLGLVANNFVYILCWGWFDYAESDSAAQRAQRPDVSSSSGVIIHAAIMALNEGFGYEPYHMTDAGNYSPDGWTSANHQGKGAISLRGSLIQAVRKPVGVLTTPYRGYSKDYVHDPRMRFDSSPYFLEPENAGWEIVSWREVNDHVELDNN